MKFRLLRSVGLVFGITAIASISFAQTRITSSEKFVVSAKAGAVNAVVGEVSVDRGGRNTRLFKGDEVQTDEVVSTGNYGKAEILMNPGSYLRLGANSSFKFDSTDLDDVRVTFLRGSAIFEVFGTDDFTVDVKAGSSRFAFVDSGIYRVDFAADGNANVSIVKGKVLPSLEAKKAVKSGKTLDYTGSEYVVAKFDREPKDDLDIWSRDRAKELSTIAKSLRPDMLRNSLINSFYGRRWDLYNSFGLWIYDPFYRSFCFLPFGYGWNSAYGYGFGRSLWYYRLPPVIYQAPPPAETKRRTATHQTNSDVGFSDVMKQRSGRSTRVMVDSSESVETKQRTVQVQRIEPPMSFPTSTIEPVISAPSRSSVKKP